MRNVPARIQKPRVVSNNSVIINFSQIVLQTKRLGCELIINLPLLLILVGLTVSKILREIYRSGFKKPRVVSNYSVNINFIQKVLETKSFACEMTRRLASLHILSRISSFEDIGFNVHVWIQKPRVVSNYSVNKL